jgi:hypothetical protein
MKSNKYNFEPIGIIHSPFKSREDIPRRKWFDPHAFDDVHGEVEVFKNFEPGLDDIDGFSHLILIFVFHESLEINLHAHPPFDSKEGHFCDTESSPAESYRNNCCQTRRKRKKCPEGIGFGCIRGNPCSGHQTLHQKGYQREHRLRMARSDPGERRLERA